MNKDLERLKLLVERAVMQWIGVCLTADNKKLRTKAFTKWEQTQKEIEELTQKIEQRLSLETPLPIPESAN